MRIDGYLRAVTIGTPWDTWLRVSRDGTTVGRCRTIVEFSVLVVDLFLVPPPPSTFHLFC